MRVFFVRHGESLLNVERRHQGPHGALSEKGRKQAEYVAHKLQQFSIDAIYSSPFERTMETAEIIRTILKQEKVVESDLFREVVAPSILHGKIHTDPESVEIRKVMREKQHDVTWRHSDEESMEEVFARCRAGMAYLEEQPGHNIVVVSHAGFMRALVPTLALREKMDTEAFYRFLRFFVMANTGITVLQKVDDKWRFLTWNDYAHLNELGV